MTKVLLFGRLRDLAGWREQVFVPPPERLSGLKGLIRRADPVLADALEAPGVRAAVNQVLVRGDPDLAPGSEVAFMPPMSGG